MSDENFRQMLDAFMVDCNHLEAPILKQQVYLLLNEEARLRGFSDWLDAYNKYA